MTAGGVPPAWDLRLYVAGTTAKSQRAIENLRHLCSRHVPGNHRIEVIDLLEHPELAEQDQIIAIPTLVRGRPLPVRKIVGDLSATDRVLLELDILPETAAARLPGDEHVRG